MNDFFTITYPYGDFSKARVLKNVDPSELGDVSAFRIDAEGDLRDVSGAVLVSLYNQVVPEDRRIKKFEKTAVAIRRVFPLLDQMSRLVPEEEVRTSRVKKAAAPKSRAVEPGKGSPAKGKRLGIGKRMAELLRDGKSTEEVLATIREEFPLSRATAKDVSIIRRREGIS